MDYLDLERRFRGTEEEIADWLRPHLPYLPGAARSSTSAAAAARRWRS
jgi:hypothetical protein